MAKITAARKIVPCAVLAALLWLAPTGAAPFEELSLDRWTKLREVERYQLNIAEKYYKDQKWKVAADEYEKFLKLYDRSDGAPYAQLKWSHCQVHLRKQNTAIKDGYQSVIDYYPESPEAVAAAYLIGKTYLDTGNLKDAKKALAKVLTAHPKDIVAVYARLDLVDVAGKESDTERRVKLLRELTFDVDRKGEAAPPCVQASHQLANHCFATGDFAEGLKALETSHKDDSIPTHLMHPSTGRLPQILNEMTAQTDEAVKKRALRVADEAISYLRVQVKSDLGDEKRRPRAVQCWYYIADIQLHARRPEKQREVYEEMLAALGTDDKLLGHLAQWYKANNKRDLARATYAKYKDAAEGQHQIAHSWIEENKFEPAIDIYRKLSLDDVKNAGKWLSQAAYTYRRASKPDPAIAIYRELLTTDVNNAAGYHWEIAETLYNAHRWKEALTTFRGTERFPENYQRMAMCQRELKQYDEAIALYQQIMGGHAPSASWALLQIAYTHEQASRTEPAIKAFKLVCDRYPKTAEGSTAHEHLNRVYKISVTLGGAKD